MYLQKIAILCSVVLVACSTPKPPVESIITDFPVKPKLTVYSKPPVIKKVDENFLVTEELITNSVQLIDYYKRLETWKEKKQIR